ncbi:MAG: tRNA lysidine(34) synthetase TilS [Ardenticatenaceae bacterium]|nr:tRNA lysidine(34) synthetase TilS [Ardenticatenaceae bacterium]
MKNDKEDRRLWRTVVQTIRPFPLTLPQTKLLVGVSGGADSLALLHMLWRQLGADRLVVAHLNHGLRAAADEEATFVEATAVAWHIPFVGQKIDVAELAEQEKLSLEAAGRLARYEFLAEQAQLVGATAVAVAHHADDQAETVLLHLLRGSGSAGLRGMLPVGEVPGASDVVLVRPFLHLRRAEIEAYCARHGLKPRIDDSNEDVQFVRNRIRHELLPLLESYNPQISASLQQLAAITADEYAALSAQFDALWPTIWVDACAEWLKLDRGAFIALPVAWQRLALRRAVQQLRPFHTEISFATIEQARLLSLEPTSGTAVFLPGGLVMQVTAGQLVLGDVGEAQSLHVPQVMMESPVALPIPGEVELAGGWRITAVLQPDLTLADVQQNRDPWRAFAAVEQGDVLWVRPSHPGERFQPLGLGGHSQAIQDLLSDRKVARGERPWWPIVAAGEQPAWIVGLHLDERMRVQGQSRLIVQLTCTQQADF